MSESLFSGVFPVAAAPFTEEGDVDHDGLQSLVDFQIRAGARGVVLFGFATEFYKLAEAEKRLMLQTAIEAAARRVPVVASITEQSTELAVRKAREMEGLGADALMVLPPFVLPCGSDGFVRHVKAVAQAVEIPLVVQYSPQETGVALEPWTLADLMASRNNLRCLKIEAKPPGPVISAVLAKAARPAPDIFVGYAGLQMIDALARGATGVMPGSSLTDLYCRIHRAYLEGGLEEARVLHGRLVPFLNFIFQSIEMIVKWEKVILKRRGIIASEYCRYPAYEPDAIALGLFEAYYAELALCWAEGHGC